MARRSDGPRPLLLLLTVALPLSLLSLLLASLLALAAAEPRPRRPFLATPRVINGHIALQGEFPSVVSVRVYLEDRETGAVTVMRCGGSLLSEHWILTAGHCIRSRTPGLRPTRAAVYAGSTEYMHRGVASVAYEFRLHPDYFDDVPKERVTADLGLIRVDRPLKLSVLVKPARLPRQGQTFPTDSASQIVGWGWVAYEQYSTKLMQQTTRGFRYDGDLLIARGVEEGPCFGDSGGPLYIGDVTVGVTSSVVDDTGGTDCFLPGDKYFVNVALYRDWIRNVTGV